MNGIFVDADKELNGLFEKILDEALEIDKEIQWPSTFLVFSNVDECDPIELIESAIKIGLQTGLQTVYRLYAGETRAYAACISRKHLREILKTEWENI